MKGLVLTNIGLEDISATEIKQLIDAKNVLILPGKVIFNCNSEQDLITLCYHGRTFTKVVLLLSEQKSKEIPGEEFLLKLDSFLDKTAVVLCERKGQHNFTSYDVEKELNTLLSKIYNVKIDYRKPQTTFFLLIENEDCYFGVDFSGIDLGRRDYRIFLGAESLKGNMAAALLLFAEYKASQMLIDPFCRQGIIPIEAALFATGLSVHKFGKEKFAFSSIPNINFELKDDPKEFSGKIMAMDGNFKHVSSAQKNAKIAGVVKLIDFSRTELEFLDAKFPKQSVDRIITFPIQQSKMISEKAVDKVYHQLFYHAEFILTKKGKICLCMKKGIEKVKSKAKEFSFSLEREQKVLQGEVELTFLLFSGKE